jgi:hypothetical protein
MRVFYLIAGVAVLLGVCFDLIWTTLGTHGGGPISGRITAGIWWICVRVHRLRPNHRLLSLVGSFLLALIVVVWIALVWAGCFLIFSGHPDSVVGNRSRHPADAGDRFYYVGSMMFTLGSSEFVANGRPWRDIAALTGLIGLATITLAITFILQVLQSVVLKRALGAYISDVGGPPTEILKRSWTGERFLGLDGHFGDLTTMLHVVTEQHLTYPVLHYFHSERLRTATAVRLASLYETTLILNHGVAPHLRLQRMTIQPLTDSLSGFADVIRGTFVHPKSTPPPAPSLQPLREIGVKTVTDTEFAAAADAAGKIRRFFLGLVVDDGWEWSDVHRR